jgi:hypothetical protein
VLSIQAFLELWWSPFANFQVCYFYVFFVYVYKLFLSFGGLLEFLPGLGERRISSMDFGKLQVRVKMHLLKQYLPEFVCCVWLPLYMPW